MAFPGWKPPVPADAWPTGVNPYSPWSLTYLTPYRAYQEPPLPDVQMVSRWLPWEQTVPIFQKDFKSLNDLSRAEADVFMHLNQRVVFRFTKKLPEALRVAKMQEQFQTRPATAKDATVTCIGIRGLSFMVEWPELECTQGFSSGYRQLAGIDPDQYQAITKSIQTLPCSVMAQCTASFLPVRRSPLPNVLNIMYKGFEFDVSKHGGAVAHDTLKIGEMYPSKSAPVQRVLDQFTADKSPKVVFCGRSFIDIKKLNDSYPVGFVYDSSEPTSRLAFAPECATVTPSDWSGISPVVGPHAGQPLVALFNSLYVSLELLAPMPRWINLSDDQQTRIVAPLVALTSGGQLHLSCDICLMKLPASDWQVASGYSTRNPKYSEVSMTDIQGMRSTFDDKTGHPLLKEYEEKPLNLMKDWAKPLWKADDIPANPFTNLMEDRVSRGPRAISLHVQATDHNKPRQYHSMAEMLQMPLEDYLAEFQHLQDVMVPWEYRTKSLSELATIQQPILTGQQAFTPPSPPDGDDEVDMPVDSKDHLFDPSHLSFAYL